MKNKVVTAIIFALKFFALVILSTIGFIALSGFMPFSESFVAASRNAGAEALPYVLFNSAWTCLVMVYIVSKSPWPGGRLIPALIIMMFLITSFMTQIETAFFGRAFAALTTSDIILIALSSGLLILIGVPLTVLMFGRRKAETAATTHPLTFREVSLKLLLIGLAYLFVYFAFGYFVAWQVQEVRVFYSGSPEDDGFIASLINNFVQTPVIYPFQVLRGILFGLFVLPLVKMFRDQPRQLLISLILVYSCTGMGLIIPNFLFPDPVRWAHFREMISSMFVFAMIVWFVYTKVQVARTSGLVSGREGVIL